MPPRSQIELLPEGLFDELKQRLVDSKFSDYRGHAEWLQSKGYEIRKSAVHSFGQGYQAEIERMRLSVAEAREVVKALPDSENAMNDALLRMVQHRVYQVLRDAGGEDLPPKALAALTRAIADAGRASIAQKRHADEVRKKGAEVIDEMAKATGLSEDQAAAWRAKFLGIAPS